MSLFWLLVTVGCGVGYLLWTVISVFNICVMMGFLRKCASFFRLRLKTPIQPRDAPPLLALENRPLSELDAWVEEKEKVSRQARWGPNDADVCDLHKSVVAEALWDVAQSFLGVGATLVASLAGLRGNSRTVVVYTFVGLPCVIRGKIQEARLMKTPVYQLVMKDFREWEGYPSFPYLFSIPTVIDGFSHGNVAAEAILAGDFSREIGVLWSTGSFTYLRQPLQWFDYGGVMTGSLILAATWHMGALALEPSLLPLKASLTGFGAMERQLLHHLNYGGVTMMQNAITNLVTKCVGESLLFLQWSVSFAMARAMRDNQAVSSDLAVVINVALSAFTAALAVKNAASATINGFTSKNWCATSWDQSVIRVLGFCFGVLVYSVPMIFTSYFVLLKVYTFVRADSCPHHAWGLTTGCV